MLQSGSERTQINRERRENETLGQSTNEWKKGGVKNSLGNRSYEIESNEHTNRRNRRDVRPSQHAEIDPNMYEDIDQKPIQKLPVYTHLGQSES